MIYRADEIREWSADGEIGGKWVCARQINYQFESWLSRLRAAWGVLTGRLDALRWHQQ